MAMLCYILLQLASNRVCDRAHAFSFVCAVFGFLGLVTCEECAGWVVDVDGFCGLLEGWEMCGSRAGGGWRAVMWMVMEVMKTTRLVSGPSDVGVHIKTDLATYSAPLNYLGRVNQPDYPLTY